MKFIYVSVFYLLMNFNCFSQWFEHSPRPQKSPQWDIKFYDNDYGFIIANSIIMRTTNGGKIWDTTMLSGPWYLTLLTCLYIYNRDTAYIGGSRLYSTTNGGNNWFFKTSQTIFSIYFSSPQKGVRIKYITADPNNVFFIENTYDGGNIWHSVYELNEGFGNLHKLFFTDSLRGFAIGNNGLILRTKNGSLTWDKQVSNTLQNLNSICFIDSLSGFIVGTNSLILKTIDGGVNRIKQILPITLQLNSVYFHGKNIGYIVGSGGVILKTIDGGSNWEPQQSTTNLSLNAVFFNDESNGFIVGDSLSPTVLFLKQQTEVILI